MRNSSGDGPVIRPPSEADSILLQVTRGCSHNRCAFCGIYKHTKFALVDENIVEEHLLLAAKHFPEQTRLFLCDGDALILPHDRMIRLLEKIREILPNVNRIATYANAKSISRKTDAQLAELRVFNLKLAHVGLESGDDTVLASVNKWGSAAEIVAQGRRLKEAGIKVFVTVLLGLGGTQRSLIHAQNTGRALSDMDPEYVGALSLMLLEKTPLEEAFSTGAFTLPDANGMLRELRAMLEATMLSGGIFYANHASNYLPLRVRFPRDKVKALSQIDAALSGRLALTPEWLRAL
ncbi:MAG: radical SAM protein [Chitinispirillaceae bacterium]|jgi:radical SAM superfamily enzyme YgiQ (UPF0313 family)|nr:radical SAM protein [Chitinispirillaceae bacterium]